MEGKEIIITYDTLFDLARRERYRSELQALEKSFFADVIKYLNEKQAILKSQEEKNSVFSETEAEKTRTQIVNAKKILKDLYDRREAKILQAALFHSRDGSKPQDFTGMLPDEVHLLEALEKTLVKFRHEILHSLLACRHNEPKALEPKPLKTEEGKEEQDNRLKIKCSVPEFVGPDMKAYGPFSEGDKVKLPDNIAEMLVKNGHAVAEK